MGRPGQAPGTAEYTGEPRKERVKLDLTVFSPTTHRVLEDITPDEAAQELGDGHICWLDIDGIHDPEWVKAVGARFNIHRLSIEDILDPEGRAKVEPYPEYLYLVARMVTRASAQGDLETEQISLLLGRGFVVTFQEHDGDVFDSVRKRLRNPGSLVRERGPDYLSYALIDAIVDDYFIEIDRLGALLEVIDAMDPAQMPPETPGEVHRIKRRLMTLRKSIRPLHAAVGALLRDGKGEWIRPETAPFLRDLMDNLTHELDDIDLHREVCVALLDLYQATADHRMNEEMRVLTVIATIFIPLTFITGLYGMNFDNMPELHSQYGYYSALGAMIATAGSLVIYFRRKGWL